MKLHLGCGSVYLTPDWKNIDVAAPNTFLAQDRPDLVQRWKTTEENYYGRHQDKTIETLSAGPLDQEYVCDEFGNFLHLPIDPRQGPVTEILIRQSWEHLSISEAKTVLKRLRGLMAPGALLRIDVPDHEKTLQLFRETGHPFYIRHLLGPRRNAYGFHMMSYDRAGLKELCESEGFEFVEEEPDIHIYPSVCLRFRKPLNDEMPAVLAPCDYVPIPPLPTGARMLDVGPGRHPHPRADVYVDNDTNALVSMKSGGGECILDDIEDGLTRFRDKEFDFVWCSHVLEHVDDPTACAATLSRIAKRGVIVMPSIIKDSLFNFEEDGHKWAVLPHPRKGGVPIFVRHNADYMAAIKDQMVQKAMCFLFRTGSDHDCTAERNLHEWFLQNEAHLDVVHHWEGTLRLEVVR